MKNRVAIISCGMISTSAHIPAYLHYSREYEIVAVCDINEVYAKETANKFNIQNYYTDAELMLKEQHPDVVSVCAPNMLHKQYAMLSLKYGANVLCEKPVAFKYSDAKEMYDYAKKQGKYLMACQSLRYMPERIAAKKLIDNGEFGDIYYGELSRIRRRGIPTWGKFHIKEFSGGGALVDIGVHALDSAIWLMGNPKVKSVTDNMNKVHTGEIGSLKSSGVLTGNIDRQIKFDSDEMNVESFASGLIKFETGAALSFKTAWAANLNEENNIRLSGSKMGVDIEKGMLYYGENSIISLKKEKNLFSDEPFFGHFYLVGHFAKVLSGEEEIMIKPEETLSVSAIIEAAYLSSALDREVFLDEIIG